MNEFYVIFENDDRDNRLFDTKRSLHYAKGVCYMLIIAIAYKAFEDRKTAAC